MGKNSREKMAGKHAQKRPSESKIVIVIVIAMVVVIVIVVGL